MTYAICPGCGVQLVIVPPVQWTTLRVSCTSCPRVFEIVSVVRVIP